MLKKTITYIDYNGVERTEDFWFNLNNNELVSLDAEFNGGLSDYIHRIVDKKDVKSLMRLFETVLSKSYGVKSDDGRRFIKSEDLFEDFKQTEAYDSLFMELIMNENKAVDFINSVVSTKGLKNGDKK